MARVPTAGNVRQVSSPNVSQRRVAAMVKPDTTGADILSVAGEGLVDVAEHLHERQQQALADNAALAWNETQVDLALSFDSILADMQNTVEPGAPNFAETVRQRMEDHRKAFLADLPNRHQLRESDLEAIDRRSSLLAMPSLVRAADFERDERVRHATENLGGQIEAIALAVRRDPTSSHIELAMQQGMGAIGNLKDMTTPAEQQAFEETLRRKVHVAALEGGIEADPEAMLQSLQTGQFDNMTSQGITKDELVGFAEDARDLIEDRQQAIEGTAADEDAVALMELTVAVNRGQAGERDIRAALQAGQISPSKASTLIAKADAVGKKRQEEVQAAQQVEMALAGGLFMDPRDGDDRKSVNDYFNSRVAPRVAGLPQEEQAGAMVAWIDQVGIIPDVVGGQIRGALRAGDAGRKAQAADMLDRLVTTNPKLADEFSETDIDVGLQIAANVRAGLPAGEAVSLAEDAILRTTDSERDLRLSRMRDEKMPETNAVWLTDQLEGGFFGFGTSEVPEALTGEFNAQFRQHFMRTGDQEVARKASLASLRNVWGVTEIGNRRWQRFAPEAVYRVTADDDGAWMAEQLREELTGLGVAFDEDTLRLEADPNTLREAQPSYIVMDKDENGAFVPLLHEDTILRWRPEWKSSPEFLRLQEELAAEAEAELEKAERRRAFAADPENVPLTETGKHFLAPETLPDTL